MTVCRDAAPELPGATVLSGATARTRPALFAALAGALTLPAHLGSTWDALSDVLRDRLDAGPLTLLIIDAGELLVDEPTGQYALLFAVFGDLATSAPHPLRVVLHGASPADR
ncbi:RNAse (barnase) inhibitor barstar [Micromonospora jinlongensis]|uniref:RNAse (Barnase) inhibitor barstar n=1 Tax=Micromonospora jinlongensis TaxID=1287877 RepID=A0A7Z0BC00_9ACTN|nr:barstar family protein [Micromonospora jinlongensis]NYH41336.1 RNAse (barnase) inhibitor barstar [Micromonospora jinlongensis]